MTTISQSPTEAAQRVHNRLVKLERSFAKMSFSEHAANHRGMMLPYRGTLETHARLLQEAARDFPVVPHPEPYVTSLKLSATRLQSHANSRSIFAGGLSTTIQGARIDAGFAAQAIRDSYGFREPRSKGAIAAAIVGASLLGVAAGATALLATSNGQDSREP